MTEPDDFGMSAVRTMAHVCDPVKSSDHSGFWKRWYERLVLGSPVLRERTTHDPSDPSATHDFESIGGVRIGCSLVIPHDGARVRGALVTTHGYTNPPTLGSAAHRWRSLADNGVAVLELRLRGYPGSQLGIGDQTLPDESGAGWIGRGFAAADASEWILPHAIADVCNGVRIMRNILLRRGGVRLEIDPELTSAGVWMHGESLGGGIATIASALLMGRLPGETIIDRLAIALPSLGDWRWRLHQECTGTTLDIRRVIGAHADRAAELVDRVRLCDSAVHAAHVRIPTLAMLATRDSVVPAPAAAAVYNAIDSGPGRKWRFVVPCGHCEGGIHNSRRHALFGRALVDFFDPQHRPMDAMERWEPMMNEGERVENGGAR
ncbi:MAG: acetylxylan esterase [Phycisphaerales bacterium]|nr:acetylxylan esterase [Phycisphaerales bacterium]